MVLSLEQLAANDLEIGRLVVPFDHRVRLQHAYHPTPLETTTADDRVVLFKEWLFREVEAMPSYA